MTPCWTCFFISVPGSHPIPHPLITSTNTNTAISARRRDPLQWSHGHNMDTAGGKASFLGHSHLSSYSSPWTTSSSVSNIRNVAENNSGNGNANGIRRGVSTSNVPISSSSNSINNGSRRNRANISRHSNVHKHNTFPPGKLPLALELDFILNHPFCDSVIAVLVSLNCLIFALQTINVGPAWHDAFSAYEQNLSILFVLEYFGRWYGKGLSPRYLLSRGMIIDFLAVAPFGLSVSGQSEGLFVRVLRLSRILRIQRVMMDTDRSEELMGSMSSIQIRLASIGMSLFSLLYVSAGLFYVVEKDVNPNVLNFFDAFYYSTITLFTVGFGDLTALTSWGRLITVLTVLTGAVLVPYQLAEIENVRKLTEQRERAAAESEWINSRRISSMAPLTGSSSNDKAANDSVFLALNDGDIECKRCFLKGHQSDARFCRNCGALLSKRRFDK